jgi:biopolymer transport protein ExbB
MKTTVAAILLLIGAEAAAQNSKDSSGALSSLADSARGELAQSIADLNRMRDEIAAEKLPLAQELTKIEERLSELRKEHERVTRLADEGSLELARLKAEKKAHEDELAYVGNLLDEYARTFETKIHVSELQFCGEALTTAKQATENPELSQDERFKRQTSFVETSVARLKEALGGMRFPGVGVDLTGAVVSGQYALLGPVALFAAANGVAGLVVPQSGSANPLIRPLEGPLQAGLASLVQSGTGELPLDPSRGAALKALIQKTNLYQIFEKGGPIMWPLLFAAVLALGTVLERVFFLLNEGRKRDPKALERLLGHVEHGELVAAVQDSANSRDFVVRTLRYALTHKEQSLSNALLYAQAQELKRFQRGVSILDTVITLAPLLGLLGTVTGMMGSFSLIGGELSAPGAITGGIAEALIATAFGLGIAITALLPFNVLNTKLENAQHELESAAAQLELLMQSHAAPASEIAPQPAPERAPRLDRPQPVGAGKS